MNPFDDDYKGLPDSVKNMINEGKIPHAIMIEGDIESGNRLAEYLSAACVCEGGQKPCGVCRQCITANNRSNPDITYISAEDSKKNITVSQIRDMRSSAFIKPHSAQRRIFIIHQAQRMNETAQNALLKVLEEPPEFVVFILVVPSRTLMLSTVISRCTLIPLQIPDLPLNGQDGTLNDAKRFLELVFSSSRYDMLLFFRKFEKDRKATEDFFIKLKSQSVSELRKNYGCLSKARVLSGIYDDCGTYLELLKTNINLPLLFTAVCIRTKQLTEI